ncbi:LysR family transcriptional regulator [Streptomyces broussonetiae]|uniref:LysR family transcriptional regulator n=1 Tax=Streptomyces broussonetiae TaxID=2686304 RepID=A0A6I6N176_9ACTN|nr:LysR family transcriptional regulator [Streptomyces broussonetiae]QHA02575.1 LysR family transcriptional regulator [Streptomyces broussonetiae]
MAADHRGAPGADDLANLEWRRLRYFVAVAEAGTVTEAARRLHIAQPSLSQQIRLLERSLGTPLFQRLPRGMELTEQGRLVLGGVNRALGELRSSVAAARAVALTATVGLCRGVPQSVLARAEQVMTHGQRLRIGYEQADSQSQVRLLRAGALAFGILRTPVDDSGLTLCTVNDEPLGVVLHRRHPLAGRPELTWPELSGQRLLWFPAARAPGYAATVLECLQNHGWTPETLPEEHSSHTLFRHHLMGHDDLVALRTRSASSGDPDLLWRPVGPEPPRERLALAAAAHSAWAGRLTAVTTDDPAGSST